MGELRPGSLSLALASLLILSSCLAAQGAPDVQVRNLNAPGAASVTNHGPDIALSRKVTVEQHVGASWTATDADVRLIAACGDLETKNDHMLRKGETLILLPWNGWTCGGQCAGSCRANVYLGPGEFRFVVVSASGKQRFAGPAFMLGPEAER
jgi:hypothetical protein